MPVFYFSTVAKLSMILQPVGIDDSIVTSQQLTVNLLSFSYIHEVPKIVTPVCGEHHCAYIIYVIGWK